MLSAIQSNRFYDCCLTSCLFDPKQLKISFVTTGKLLSMMVGIRLAISPNIVKAFVATLMFGSLICLLRTSMTLLLNLCCANS